METARRARIADVAVSRHDIAPTGPRTETVPIYVVRHAKAGSRRRWTGPDDRRPLSRPGLEQAAGLVRLFAGRPLARLVSSPYIRCVQTLEPLSEERGVPLETSPILAEGASPDGALSLAVDSAQLGPTALCTHGDVIELLLEELSHNDIQLETEGDIELKKGSTWILQLRDGDVVSAEYVPPYGGNSR
jgi:8-oxo-dGTP diphosphatase